MGLKPAGRLVPASLRCCPDEAKRIAEGAKWNKKALEILKANSFSAHRIKHYIATKNPPQEMVDALRRVYRETRQQKGGL